VKLLAVSSPTSSPLAIVNSLHIFRSMSSYKVPKTVTDSLNYVNGERLTPSKSSHKFKVISPSTGNLLVECSASGVEDVEAAVQAAKAAFPEWSKLSGLERGNILRKASEIMKEHIDDIAALEVLHNGKPIYEAKVDILYAAETFAFYGGLAANIHGEHIPMSGGMNFAYTRREPLGVCGGIGAWNYPFQTCSWKCAPALACGNTFVYKPSPWAPLTPVVLAELLTLAGVPKGVVNIVQGERETGEALVSSKDVAKISFTGSVPTGQRIMEVCAKNGLKKVTLELGGKSPLIIFDDCNMENAVKGAMMANFLTQGEVCSNGTRVYVHKKIYNEFLDKLIQRTKNLKVGDPFKDDTTVGATITKFHMDKVLNYVETAKKEGAKVLCGGEQLTINDEKCKNGFYISPCVLTDVTDDMQIAKEEVFGAVMSVLPFDDEADVVKRANNTPYGLSAGVFTNNLAKAHRVVAQLQAGFIWINNYNVQPVEIPFGGYKMSGFGRELGAAAIDSYTQLKSVYVELGDVDTAF
jgi:aldehyde dehydrogenase family 9 protein A1